MPEGDDSDSSEQRPDLGDEGLTEEEIVFLESGETGRVYSRKPRVPPDEHWGDQHETADSALEIQDVKMSAGKKIQLKIGSFSVEGSAWLAALAIVLFFGLLAWITWVAGSLFG